MNKDSLMLTLVILVMIAALAVAAVPTAERLKDLLMTPGKAIRVEQVARI